MLASDIIGNWEETPSRINNFIDMHTENRLSDLLNVTKNFPDKLSSILKEL